MTMEKETKTTMAKAKKYVITQENGKPVPSVQITGLPIKITNENVNDENVLKAIANFEKRKNRQIIGVFVRLV